MPAWSTLVIIVVIPTCYSLVVICFTNRSFAVLRSSLSTNSIVSSSALVKEGRTWSDRTAPEAVLHVCQKILLWVNGR